MPGNVKEKIFGPLPFAQDAEAAALVPARMPVDDALATVDESFRLGRRQQAGMQLRQLPAGVLQADHVLQVDARGRKSGHRLYAAGIAQQQQRQKGGVYANVQQGSSAQLRLYQPRGGRIFHQKAKIGLQPFNSADGTLCQLRQQAAGGGQKTRPQGLHQKYPVRTRQPGQFESFAIVDRPGLFAQHRLAGFYTQLTQLTVAVVGGGNVHHIQLRTAEDVLVAAIGVGDAVGFGESLGSPLVARRHRPKAGARHQLQVCSKLVGDFSRPDNTPPPFLFFFVHTCWLLAAVRPAGAQAARCGQLLR